MSQEEAKHQQMIENLHIMTDKAIESVISTDEMLLDLIEDYLSINEDQFYSKTDVKIYGPELQNIELQLKKLLELGQNAKLSVEKIEVFSQHTKDILALQTSKTYGDSLDERNKYLSTLTKKFQNDCEVFLSQVSRLLRYVKNVN